METINGKKDKKHKLLYKWKKLRRKEELKRIDKIIPKYCENKIIKTQSIK
jgi:hypothetical protein